MSSADLASWLLEQIAEDQERAELERALPLRSHLEYSLDMDLTIHPTRVLAECEAKRRIVEKHHKHGAFSGECAVCLEAAYPECLIMADYPCDTLRLLALPYADRPGYQEEWRP